MPGVGPTVYGSIERFLGMLLEHHGGQLPAWIAPEQVLVAPVGEAHREHATAVVMVMAAAGLRVRLDAEESLARRIGSPTSSASRSSR